jgi:hypothetical protein
LKRREIAFNQEEVGLIAVIFGAWLMQKSDLHEKQVVLLTTIILFLNRRWNSAARTDAAAAQYQISERAGF